MTYQVLARKWRPKAFDQMVGQPHVVTALANALDTGRLHHAYLFTGTRGVGKTTLARILAKAINCETGVSSRPCGKCRACTEIDSGRFVDLLEVDAATNTKVDEMRELLDTAQYMPVSGRFKVYIIDEVHMLSRHAFNSMLKTLEEPPEHVKFILATTDPQRLPVTVLSRCLQFNLKPLPPQMLAGHLKRVLEAEGIPFEEQALVQLARAAAGSVRDSLSLTDQAIAFGSGKVLAAQVSDMLGAVGGDLVWPLLERIAAADGPGALAEAERISERGLSCDQALQDVAAILHRVALAQIGAEPAPDDPDSPRIAALAQRLDAGRVQVMYQVAILGRRDLSLAPDEIAGFGMAVMRMLSVRYRVARRECRCARDAGAAAAGESRPAAAAAACRGRERAPRRGRRDAGHRRDPRIRRRLDRVRRAPEPERHGRAARALRRARLVRRQPPAARPPRGAPDVRGEVLPGQAQGGARPAVRRRVPAVGAGRGDEREERGGRARRGSAEEARRRDGGDRERPVRAGPRGGHGRAGRDLVDPPRGRNGFRSNRKQERQAMMKGGLGGLMKQAQQMQENMRKVQESLETIEVEGQSGAGLVKVVMTCKFAVRRVTIDPSLLGEDKDMLEDLVAAAFNDAARKAEATTQEKMAGFTAGLNLPPGMKLPF